MFMIGLKSSFWNSLLVAGTCALSLMMSAGTVALATELPPGVLNYLRQKDPKVKVRFDGLVLFSNGESYVPVIPQDPGLNPDSQLVIATLPENKAYPDLIQFDNNFFLMRLILTSSGRMTFPKMDEYPLQLKEGLLPQDFVMPGNLFIPVELKIILGALPYKPDYVPEKKPVLVPPSVALSQQGGEAAQFTVTNRQTYIFDLNGQKILAIEPLTGKNIGEVSIGGVPASMEVSLDGKLLFVPSLSSNELVVVDTGSNLVKTRVPVGQRPDSVLYIPAKQEVIVSNRYSAFLSVIDAAELKAGVKVPLPGNGGMMALMPGKDSQKLLVADAGKPQLYLVDLSTRAVEKTIPAPADISAIKVFKETEGHLEIWVASRSQNEVTALDLNGTVLKKLTVGKKPVDMAYYENQLFVLSAGDARVDVIDLGNKTLKPSIALPEDSFPSDMVSIPSEQRAYITTAGSTDFITLNLPLKQIENTLPVSFRASMISMTPDGKAPDEMVKLAPSQPGQTAVTREPLPGKQAHKDKDAPTSSEYTGSTERTGGIRRHFNVIKFGKDTDKKPTQDDASELPVKPGARFDKQDTLPADASDANPIGPAAPTSLPDMLDDQKK